jgi:UDP-N-acetylglucosamine--N-acetylmuramyl-(pentapeptide) pyrophosphoryl-undecaprenol N-acetylglucosamine transferase
MGLSTTDILWVGTRGQIEEKLVPRANLRLETIEAGAIAGVSWRLRAVNAAKLLASLPKAKGILDGFQPDVLLMTGGYVNGPVAIVAWRSRVPSAIYLPDIEPGKAIKSLSRLVQRIACTAPASQKFFPTGKTEVTGYPIRPELRAATKLDKLEALAKFNFRADRPTLFVFGGSRGARSINQALIASLPQLLKKIQIIHISGTLDWLDIETNSNMLAPELRTYYRVFPYLHEEMGAAFKAADLVLARAGASMLGECPAFGLPAILVPYPYAWRYQKVNADFMVDRGAAERLDDVKLPAELSPMVISLIQDKTRLAEMSANAKDLDVPNAGDNLAKLLIGLAKRAIR